MAINEDGRLKRGTLYMGTRCTRYNIIEKGLSVTW